MRRSLLSDALLVAVCLLSYANGLTGDYTYDDKAIVRDNVRLRQPGNVGELFTTPYFGGARGQGTGYRPILLLSFAVQWWIHGDRVEVFHAVNLLLHVLATLLLYRVLIGNAPSPHASLGAALLFAVHPIHVEAVTSLVGRGELLAAVFVLGFLILAPRAEAGSGRRALALAGVLLLYALGILTKENAAVAPALAFLLDWRRAPGGAIERARVTLRRGGLLYGGCAVVLAGIFLARRTVLGGMLKSAGFRIFELENPLAPLPVLERLPNAAAVFFRYLGRILLPVRLSADESAWSIPVARGFDAIGAVALLLLIGLVVLSVARARSAFAFGFLFFLVAFLPAANLLFPTGTIFAERLAYLPSAGILLAVATVVAGSAPTAGSIRSSRAVVLGAITLVLATRTVVQNRVWADDDTLFAETVRSSPRSAKSHYNLAWVYAQRGDLRDAVQHYAKATAIYPNYFDAWAGKGNVEHGLGDLDAAERSLRRSLEVSPAYENGFFRLGRVLEDRGDDAGAEAVYARGIARNPKSTPLAYRLAIVRTRLRRPSAEPDWRHGIALARGATPFRMGYAEFLLAGGRVAEARRQAREVLRRRPREPAALRLLANTSEEGAMRLAEALALERLVRATAEPAALARLRVIAREDPGYAPRFARMEPALSALIRSRPALPEPAGVSGGAAPRSPAAAPPATPPAGAAGGRGAGPRE